MRTLGQFVGILLLIGFVGAYFWPIALTLAAAYLSYRDVLHALVQRDADESVSVAGDDRGVYGPGRCEADARRSRLRCQREGAFRHRRRS
jgi:hypothetical protein